VHWGLARRLRWRWHWHIPSILHHASTSIDLSLAPAPHPACSCPHTNNELQVRPVVAQYLGFFQASSTAGGITSGSQWLVWRFESDSTLGDACDGALGPFPVSGWVGGWGMFLRLLGWLEGRSRPCG
jgi:hypothetical protein